MTSKSLIVLLLTLFSFQSWSQEGIQFEDISWDAALTMAKEQDKLIFVDAYTTWCGPCKWMSKEVFTDSQVASFYNASFINIKMDMEKGDGPIFSDKYKIMAYPTLLFINGNGDRVHVGLGARGVDKFLILGQRANDPNTQLYALQQRYASGDKSPDFLKTYVTTLDDGGLEKGQVVNDYLETQSNWKTKDNLTFIYKHSGYEVSNYLFKYMMDERPSFIKVLGKSKVDDKMDQAVSMSLPPDADAAQLRAAYQEYFPKSWESRYLLALLRNITSGGILASHEETVRIGNQYMADYPQKDWTLWNGLAWHLFEVSDKKEILMEAASWALKSIDIESNAYNNDTAAWIYYKMGDLYKATAFADLAITKGEQDGDDVSSTRDLVSRIKAASAK